MHIAVSSEGFDAGAVRDAGRPEEFIEEKPAKRGPAGGKSAQQWLLLDLVRIVAALLVVSGHVRSLYFGSAAGAWHHGVTDLVFKFATGISQEAVVLFFVVSGFLVGGPAAQLIENRSFDPWSYLINRFVRIYIVFIPCLALAWILNRFCAAAFAGTNAHADMLDGWSDFDLPCYLAGLQGIMCPAHANPPLWSLGYEWLLYLLAPVVFYVLFSASERMLKAAALVLLLVMAHALLPASFMWAWLVYWFIGTLAYRVLSSCELPVYTGLAGLGIVLIGCVVARAHTDIASVVVRTAIAGGLALAVSCRPLMSGRLSGNSRLASVAAYLAGFSFSLYAIHLPVAVAFARLLEWLGLIAPQPGTAMQNGVAFVATIAVAVVAAIGFASVTEAHTSAVRRMVLKRRTRRAAP
jgi:peptidoglycan/LPS O-acetylase OafA/YrhL